MSLVMRLYLWALVSLSVKDLVGNWTAPGPLCTELTEKPVLFCGGRDAFQKSDFTKVVMMG